MEATVINLVFQSTNKNKRWKNQFINIYWQFIGLQLLFAEGFTRRLDIYLHSNESKLFQLSIDNS